MPYLYGERIRLRAVEKEDIPTFLRWINDVDVTENLVLITPWSHTQEERWYEAMLKRHIAEHALVIEVKVDEDEQIYYPIGNCQFIDINWRNRSAEVGIMIGEKSYWGKGFGTEVMRVLLTHGFNSLNLNRIWLRVIAENRRGIRAYEKAGFVHEGIFRQDEYRQGKYHDVYIMSVLKDEWENNRSN
jgi:diamine N-acetyltransferase